MRLWGVGAVLVISVALVPGIVRGASGVFKTGSSADVDGRPSGIAFGNFDEDPDDALDAVVSNSDTGTVSVLIGFNDGTLAYNGSFPAGNGPSGVVAGKLDADAHLDLLVANENAGQVVFLKGNGDGTFEPPGDPVPVGKGARAIVVGNFDGDANLDVAVACEGDTQNPTGSVYVLRGHGNGTFSTQAVLTAEQGTRAVAIGRIDSDQFLDIVAVNSISGSVSVFFGKSTNFTFTSATKLTTGRTPKAVALGHLNNDNAEDIVTADFDDDAVSVLLSNGNRTFKSRTTFPVGIGPGGVLIGDLSGDGRADVVTSNEHSGDVSVLLGDGTGKLGAGRHFVSDLEPLVIGLGNFNNDGLPDVVTANSDAQVWVLVNEGGGRLATGEDLPAGSVPAAVVAGDLDNDGFPDLVVTHSSGQVLAFRALPDGGFSPGETVATVGGYARDVAVVDLNRDGVLDLAIVDDVSAGSDDVVVELGRGNGTFGEPASSPVADGSVAITPGDFNGDNLVDLAVAGDGSEGVVSVLIGRGNGVFDPFRPQDVGDTPVAIAAGDFTCDGRDDLLVANHALPSTISVLVGNPDKTFTPKPAITNAGNQPVAIAVANMNRDGQPDFVVSSVQGVDGNNLYTFLGQSQPCDAAFSRSFGASSGGGLAPLAVRDFGMTSAGEPAGSRFVDLAVVNSAASANAVRAFVGNGQGRFTSRGTDNVGRMPVAIAAADFDGDGRYDVATANGAEFSSNVSVLTNVKAPAALRGDGNGDARVSAADVSALLMELTDGDGKQVEDTGLFGPQKSPVGVDANGDGRVDSQDIGATVRRVFFGG